LQFRVKIYKVKIPELVICIKDKVVVRLCKAAVARVSFIPLILLVLKMHTHADRIIRCQLDLTQGSLAVVVAVAALEVSESIVAAVKNATVTLLPELAVVVDIVVIVVAEHVISRTANVFVIRDHDLVRVLVE
jgi:hypothetical protein